MLWQKDAVMQDLLSKNHVLSEQTGGRKNADRGHPLFNEFGELAKSAGAIEFLAELM